MSLLETKVTRVKKRTTNQALADAERIMSSLFVGPNSPPCLPPVASKWPSDRGMTVHGRGRPQGTMQHEACFSQLDLYSQRPTKITLLQGENTVRYFPSDEQLLH